MDDYGLYFEIGSLLKREGDSARVWILSLLSAVSWFRVDSFGSN